MKKIIYCGFGKLGFDCLKKLTENNTYKVVYILTHKEEQEFSVDTLAKKMNISYSYVDLRKKDEEILNILEKNQIEYLISINYRYIIPKKIFEKVKFPLNIHGSLLPKYRGRTPHVWNIINGEKITGITCHKIEEIVDAGDIIHQEEIEIKNEYTGNDLLIKMQEKYPEILMESLNKVEKKLSLKKQNENEATYYGKRVPEMGYISFYNNYSQIYNFVRAQAFPYPGAYYFLKNGKKIIIDQIEKEKNILETNDNFKIGKIVEIDGDYYTKCLDAIIKLKKYRFEGE